MKTLFISDLHLANDQPRLTEGFLALLTRYGTEISTLYILGDWFEAWVGDDDDDVWLNTITEPLKALNDCGVQIWVQHGNRDFAMGQEFLDRFGGQLLPERVTLVEHGLTLRVEHGDALCLSDHAYQEFRKMSRNPEWQANILAQPLEMRRQLAAMIRMKSKMSHANNADNIIDVDLEEVVRVIGDADGMIHGHTHRPMVHELVGADEQAKRRYVLGDWRVDAATQAGEAVIALWDEAGLRLETFRF
ncbi:MAG: UDP-2,3-diacylglucosamine diphosphatase [Gammaproteobacteria bacterium]|nr:UDP-2,3-diacylglucosamine diphosphatase [Gammaproteobacteria bacterium]